MASNLDNPVDTSYAAMVQLLEKARDGGKQRLKFMEKVENALADTQAAADNDDVAGMLRMVKMVIFTLKEVAQAIQKNHAEVAQPLKNIIGEHVVLKKSGEQAYLYKSGCTM